MLARYVWADLVRNPRRTLSTMVGVTLGVGLFCGVLFFIDGLRASMTQRAVAPLAIDMQRILTDPVGGELTLTQAFEPAGPVQPGQPVTVRLELRNTSELPANEVIVRSLPDAELAFVAGSAAVNGNAVTDFDDNPFAHGEGQAGLNVGSLEPGDTVRVAYVVEAVSPLNLDDKAIASSFSTRESVNPVPANAPAPVPAEQLAEDIRRLAGVAYVGQLSIGDLAPRSLAAGDAVVDTPVKVFGFDAAYADRDKTIDIVAGELTPGKALISAEASRELGVGIGDRVSLRLPDDTALGLEVGGIADLSGARSLFSSRRGDDLETFVYLPASIAVDPNTFANDVLPAYERAASARGERLKNPPIRELDIGLRRNLLDADPATALLETQRIAAEVTNIAPHQDFLIDNISNTLGVASADADVAKRLFVFLGVPGGLLAAFLAAYAGAVLAGAQRREQATLRIRGASRAHLLRMLALRVGILTAAGSTVGVLVGYASAAAVLSHDTLQRASTASLVVSGLLGAFVGFAATGAALYLTGRRSIDREINEDRARLPQRAPLWRRFGLDFVGIAVVVGGTALALWANAFDGTPGSVYSGRAVELQLALLVLPIGVWIAGSLAAARIVSALLARRGRSGRARMEPLLRSLFWLSAGRRPWAIGNGTVVVALIVAVATSLAAFTASYDAAKSDDARYTIGSDVRITPSPASERVYGVEDSVTFQTNGIARATPVIYGVHNSILRSTRTSEVANLAAIDPLALGFLSPLRDDHFVDTTAAEALGALSQDPVAILVSVDMADFLQVAPGDMVHVLLARATDDQVEVDFRLAGRFERLPGFPDGAHALITLDQYHGHVAAKEPDFFLASTVDGTGAELAQAVASLSEGPGRNDPLHIDTRATALAKDQSSLAALNVAGLVDLDSTYALAMGTVAIAIFVFGLLLQRRREYVTLRAQGLPPRAIRALIAAEAATVAVLGSAAGVLVGLVMGYYFVIVLRPLFVLPPPYRVPVPEIALAVALILAATALTSLLASRLVNRLDPTELLRDE